MKLTKNLNEVVKDSSGLSLAISVLVAILIGFFGGKFLYDVTGFIILFWLFLFIGFAAAFVNIKKAIKAQRKDMNELMNDPKYKAYQEYLDSQKSSEKTSEAKEDKDKTDEILDRYYEDEWDKEDRKWRDDD